MPKSIIEQELEIMREHNIEVIKLFLQKARKELQTELTEYIENNMISSIQDIPKINKIIEEVLGKCNQQNNKLK
mgnify:CR=1 FL=1